jgi:hypothetical protein
MNCRVAMSNVLLSVWRNFLGYSIGRLDGNEKRQIERRMAMRFKILQGVLTAVLVGLPFVAYGGPYPPDGMTAIYQQAAQYITNQSGISKGYCFVFGAGQGRLAYEMSLLNSNMRFVGIEENGSLVNSGRAALDSWDIYGYAIALHDGSLSSIKYRDYAAVLVISDAIIANGTCPGLASEMFRMVRPAGGVAIIGQPPGCPNPLSRTALENWLNAGGLTYAITQDSNGLWARIDRGALTGAGEWSHMWANAANTGCSQDQLTTSNLDVLWYGEPGPRILIDRHNRPMASLIKAGRMVIPGDNCVICMDTYNGARLWDLDVLNSARIAIMRDAGWIALDNDYAYVAAEDDCHKVGLSSGSVATTYHPPTANRDWGYVAVDGDLLIGSEQLVGASIIGPRVDGGILAYGDNQPVITSKALFCRNKNTGSLIWSYNNSTVIANPTICVSEDSVYFYESSASGAVGDADGRVPLATFFGTGGSLVRLNKTNGNLVWRVTANPPFVHVVYLCYASSVVVATGSSNSGGKVVYTWVAYNSSNGSVKWTKTVTTSLVAGGNHGEQDKHSMIIGSNVYHKHGSYNLQTGSSISYTWATSNCADYSSSQNHIYTRNGGLVYAYGLGFSNFTVCSEMRPGCYISIIPAGGMVVLPPYSTGCWCGPLTLQTTVAWQPQ